MEKRLVIGMAGVVATTLYAVFAQLTVDDRRCALAPMEGAASCERLVAPSGPVMLAARN